MSGPVGIVDMMNEVYKEHQDGVGLVQDYKDGAIIGFIQVALKARSYFEKFKRCFAEFRQQTFKTV